MPSDVYTGMSGSGYGSNTGAVNRWPSHAIFAYGSKGGAWGHMPSGETDPLTGLPISNYEKYIRESPENAEHSKVPIGVNKLPPNVYNNPPEGGSSGTSVPPEFNYSNLYQINNKTFDIGTLQTGLEQARLNQQSQYTPILNFPDFHIALQPDMSGWQSQDYSDDEFYDIPGASCPQCYRVGMQYPGQ